MTAWKLSPLMVLERESCWYLMGRPVRVVRGSSGLEVEVEVEFDGTRVEAMDRLSLSAWCWEGIMVVWSWVVDGSMV